MPTNTSSLIRRIAGAFPVEPKPGKEEILYEGAYIGDLELEEIKRFFEGRAWNSLTPIDIFRHRSALSFFSRLALTYFVPAWMTASLQDKETVDTAIEDLISTLSEVDPKSWTQEQRVIICEWLVHFEDTRCVIVKPCIEEALKNLGCSKD